MKKLTKEQGIILTGFTGKLCCKFSDFHKDVEQRMGKSILTHEIAHSFKEIKVIYKKDFMKMLPKKDAKQEGGQ